MTTVMMWVIGLLLTLMLALLGYLVKGLLAWGSITGNLETRLKGLETKSDATAEDVKEIRREMLKPEHLQLAVANLKLEVMRDAIKSMGGHNRRAVDSPDQT